MKNYRFTMTHKRRTYQWSVLATSLRQALEAVQLPENSVLGYVREPV